MAALIFLKEGKQMNTVKIKLKQSHPNKTMFLGQHKLTKTYKEFMLSDDEKKMIEWPEFKNRILVMSDEKPKRRRSRSQ